MEDIKNILPKFLEKQAEKLIDNYLDSAIFADKELKEVKKEF
jgi:hypothetical protein